MDSNIKGDKKEKKITTNPILKNSQGQSDSTGLKKLT